jgi:predicted Holliday junction resolvase-like endonuclease
MEEIFGMIIPIMALFIPIYAIYRGYNQSDEKIKLKKIQEEKRLEEIKQENFLLENKQMQLELDKIKEEREAREQQAVESSEHKRWLIEDNGNPSKHTQ